MRILLFVFLACYAHFLAAFSLIDDHSSSSSYRNTPLAKKRKLITNNLFEKDNNHLRLRPLQHIVLGYHLVSEFPVIASAILPSDLPLATTPAAIYEDSTLSRRQLKRLPKNTFEMGMRDAKKYYKPRYRAEIHNPNNPNNWRIDTDPGYKNGYILIAKQKVNVRNTLIASGIIYGIALVPLLTNQ